LVYGDELAGTEVRVEADYDRLRQLLDNLLGNAIEHAGPDVTVRVELTASGFAIGDDGPGLPLDTDDDIFKGDFSTVIAGTGLGLQIAKQVADAHGWALTATTSSDGGARFEITGVTKIR
jgi:signal transduction histidine kinase